jgi:hypothetical protein
LTGLLPHAIRDAVAARGDYGASESFGVVTLVVLVAVLVEREILRLTHAPPALIATLFVVAATLTFVVAVTIGVRIGDITP